MFTAFRARALIHYNTTTSPCSSKRSPQLSSELKREVEVIFTPLIKLIIGETDAGESRWMRVLAMEITRR
jgi:hypothetical protein